MAKSDNKPKPVILCDSCGKQILATGNIPFPIDYVYRDGKNLCWDCVKHSNPIQNQK